MVSVAVIVSVVSVAVVMNVSVTYFNLKFADMELGSLFEACQSINAVIYGSMLCHTVSCKYSCVQF